MLRIHSWLAKDSFAFENLDTVLNQEVLHWNLDWFLWHSEDVEPRESLPVDIDGGPQVLSFGGAQF